jgi:carboxylesterase type B
MSGSALCWWASIKRPLEKAQKLSKLLECPKDADTKTMVECLRSKTAEQLMNTHPNFYQWRHLEQSQEPMTAWSPRVDPESKVAFMPQEPIDLMTGGNFQHVPWMVGLTDDEGAFKTSAFFADLKAVREFEAEFEKLGPLLFGVHDGQSEAPKMNAQKVRQYYWADQMLDKANAHLLSNAISDSSYAHPIDTASKVHSMRSMAPVFMYHFGYRGQNSLTQLGVNKYPPEVVHTGMQFGVGNGDDLMYLFPILSGVFRPLPHDDLIFSQVISTLFGKIYIFNY